MMNLQLPPHYCKTHVMRSVLVHADCFDVFPYIADKSVNLILCDLPYGTTACKWDSILPFEKLWNEYERIITDNGAIVLTASQPFTSALVMSNPKMFKYEWIWEKAVGSNFAIAKYQPLKEHENILVFAKNKTTYNPIKEERKGSGAKRLVNGYKSNGTQTEVYGGIIPNRKGKEYDNLKYPSSVQYFNNRDKYRGLHPTQKPLELMKYLIKTYSNEDDVVMDNCMGSNTTGLACKELNRQYIGIEKEKAYYDISVKRVTECLF